MELKTNAKPPLETDQLKVNTSNANTDTKTVIHSYDSTHLDNTENVNTSNSNINSNVNTKTYANSCPTGYKYQFGGGHPLTNIMNAIGIGVYICGFIGGIVLGNSSLEYDSFDFSIAFVCWISTFISGTLILAGGEVINLLQKILDKNDTHLIREATDDFNTSVNRIKELQNLLDAGALTKEEFDMEKIKIMEFINKNI